MEKRKERTRKLTPHIRAMLIRGVRVGKPITHVCKAAGINPSTYLTWQRLAEEDDPDPMLRKLFNDIAKARDALEREQLNALTSSREILQNALVIAAHRKVEALESEDERVSQSAATEILDRFHGRPVQSVNANVTAQVAVKGYIGISPDEWDSDSAVSPATVADSAVA